MGKVTTVLTTVLAILSALLPIEMGDKTRLILTGGFGIVAGLSAALSATGTRKLSVLGIVAILIGTFASPEFLNLAGQVLSEGAAATLSRVIQIGGALLAALGAPAWTPTYPTRGFASTRLIGMIALVGMLSVAGCAAWWGPKPVPISPAAITVKLEHFADSTVATASCGDAAWRAATFVNTCEWTVTRSGTSIGTVPNGFTARAVLVGNPGDAATFVFNGRGRNPAGTVGPFGTATQPVTIGFPPISAPTITVVVTPGTP